MLARRCGRGSDSVDICICQCYVNGINIVARLGWQSSGITPDDYHFELLANLGRLTALCNSFDRVGR